MPTITFRAKIEGEALLRRRIKRLCVKLDKGLPRARKLVGAYMEYRLIERFQTGGYGRWQPIGDWALSKRKVRTDGDPPLWDTGGLMEEFSTPHDEGNAVIFKTNRRDARDHDEGNEFKNEPARPFAYIDKGDGEVVIDIYSASLLDAVNEEGGGSWG